MEQALVKKRALLLPNTRDSGKSLGLLGLVAASRPPQGPPMLWENLAAVVSLMWQGVLERLQDLSLQLGGLLSPPQCSGPEEQVLARVHSLLDSTADSSGPNNQGETRGSVERLSCGRG